MQKPTEPMQRGNIMESLQSWNDTIHLLEDKDTAGAYAFLLVLDTGKRTLDVTSFTREESDDAQLAYESAEKNTENDSNVQVVLVSVENLDALRKAYPNYYVDTRDFIAAIKHELSR